MSDHNEEQREGAPEQAETTELIEGHTLEECPALDSAEIQATTFVIDGRPMSFDEMVQYREQQAIADEAERQAAVERHRQQLAEDAADRAAARSTTGDANAEA